DPDVQRRAGRGHRRAAADHARQRGALPQARPTGRRLTMATDLQRLSAALAERMRELGCAPTDPRVAPLLAEVQALMREHLANVQAGSNVAMLAPGSPRSAPAASAEQPNGAVSYDLPADLVRLLNAYLAICPSNGFTQAPALSQSEEGRRILDLGPAQRAKMAVQAYAALTSA